MEYRYDHFGVPVKKKEADMLYYPEYKVWCSDYEKDPLKIERIFFEEGSPFHPLIKEIPHICFKVSDMQKATRGKNFIMSPISYENYTFSFIDEDGALIEFIQYL